MTFFLLLLGLFGLLWIPWLGRVAGAAACRDKMRVAAGIAFIVASLPHFFSPERYLPMMPAFIPAPRAMILVSGVAELLGGVGLLVPWTARMAAWGLAALLVAIFPANVNVALTGANAPGLPSAPWYTWSRLLFQPVFIWWVLASVRTGRPRAGPRGHAAAPPEAAR